MLAGRMQPGRRRETLLSVFGPLSLLALIGAWVVSLIFGFALLHWSLATPMHPTEDRCDFGVYWYFSGTTFFTLGYGDITPVRPVGRFLAVVEAGLGFGFLAMVIGYLPILFQASRDRTMISLLDARAGSPPSATQLLLRMAREHQPAVIHSLLREWGAGQRNCLRVTCLFRCSRSTAHSTTISHGWRLTTMLDTCTLLLAEVKGKHAYQAQLTFAIARHARWIWPWCSRPRR